MTQPPLLYWRNLYQQWVGNLSDDLQATSGVGDTMAALRSYILDVATRCRLNGEAFSEVNFSLDFMTSRVPVSENLKSS